MAHSSGFGISNGAGGYYNICIFTPISEILGIYTVSKKFRFGELHGNKKFRFVGYTVNKKFT